MTGQIIDIPGAVIPYAPKAKNTDSETDRLDQAVPFLVWLIRRLTFLRQTFKRHERLLRNLQINFEPPET